MTTNVTRRDLLATCAVVLTTLSSGCTGATPFVGKRKEVDRELDSTARRITVETDSGNASVSRTDADRIQLYGIKEAASVFANIEDMTVETTQNGDHLRISTDSETGSFLGLGGKSFSLDVGVPEGVVVESVTTKNGDVTATDIAGDVTLESTNGEVLARNVDGYVSLISMNGAVRARDIAGIDGAQVINGEIDIDIPAIDSNVSVSVTNGNITAALAPNLDATVTASTTNGDITANGLPLDLPTSRNNSLRGTFGDGTHELTITATTGDITLNRLG